MGKTTRESMKTTKLTKNRTHIIQNKRQGAEDFEGGGGWDGNFKLQHKLRFNLNEFF